jgi:hypothetical protein
MAAAYLVVEPPRQTRSSFLPKLHSRHVPLPALSIIGKLVLRTQHFSPFVSTKVRPGGGPSRSGTRLNIPDH